MKMKMNIKFNKPRVTVMTVKQLKMKFKLNYRWRLQSMAHEKKKKNANLRIHLIFIILLTALENGFKKYSSFLLLPTLANQNTFVSFSLSLTRRLCVCLCSVGKTVENLLNICENAIQIK